MAQVKYLGKTHITVEEYRCKHCKRLPRGLMDEDLEIALEYQILFAGFEEIREKRGGTPLAVNSGYRCLDYERERYEAWVAGGKKGMVQGFLSAHLFGLALDLQATSPKDRDLIVSLARKLKPAPRVGWLNYKKHGSLMVHIDYAQFIQPSPSDSFMAGVEW
jgi:hypothetical protein